jgi:hypothetical protein
VQRGCALENIEASQIEDGRSKHIERLRSVTFGPLDLGKIRSGRSTLCGARWSGSAAQSGFLT